MATILVIPKLTESQIDGLLFEFCGTGWFLGMEISVSVVMPPLWLVTLILNNNKES